MLLVITLGSLNLFLGFVIAVVLQRRSCGGTLQTAHGAPATSDPVTSDPVTAARHGFERLQYQMLTGNFESSIVPADLEDPAFVADDIPPEWIEQLRAEAIETSSFIEASVEVLKLEVGRYRNGLVAIESKLRKLEDDATVDDVFALSQELIDVNERWLAVQHVASDQFDQREESSGELVEVGQALEKVLLDQTSQIESTCTNIKSLEIGDDVNEGKRRIILETLRLIDSAHGLRDHINESTATIVRLDKKHDSLKPELLQDKLTGIQNRNGMEVTFDQWWKDDVSRHRLVSIGLMDIDGFSKVNHRFSTRVGDYFVKAVTSVVKGGIRKERGFDRIFRIDGQRWLLFLGDTGPKNAAIAVERIRQTVAATQFQYGDEQAEITVSAALIEVKKTDDLASVIERLNQTMRHAKKDGRNRTFLDDLNGPELVEEIPANVNKRVLVVE